MPTNGSAIQKLSYTHQALIDFIIANPTLDQNQIASQFGYTPSWLSQIISSDAFQSLYAKRRATIVDPAMLATVEEQFQGMVRRSLEIMREKLNKPAADIPFNVALRSFDVASRAAGYGARIEQRTNITETHLHLEELGNNLVHLLRRRKADVVEGTVVQQGDSNGDSREAGGTSGENHSGDAVRPRPGGPEGPGG